ncbi:MAG: branched-chain amino acid ABC transporter permease [Gammaproteobacteria bacterium]|nr:branched-chain amino acid ABC transporter permease [Gammaproteobacteria bacterium]
MIDFFNLVITGPVNDIRESWGFFFEVVIGGLTSGVMYSLVALGFVLIFKASAVFNFAQGVFCLFAALTLVGVMNGTMPITLQNMGFTVSPWIAVIITALVMVGLAYLVERVVLRPLVNQDPIILFMSTIGLAFVLEGVGDILWGSSVKALDVGIPQGNFEWALFGMDAMYIQVFDLWAAGIAAVLVVTLAVFFQKTAVGRALRAVADDHQAALSVGIPLKSIWVVVWSVAGLVALVAGIMWGSKSGVQFSLSLIALKALPVLILGGFTSVPGAIIGGLIIGVGEKVAGVYWGPLVNGAIENWFAYVLALVFLLFRPQGLFGEKIIERV